MSNLVFRFSATGQVERYIRDVMDEIRKSAGWTWDVATDPQNQEVVWNPPYAGFCTCGFERKMRAWLISNPHSRSCPYPDDPCRCGQWGELDRWRDGQGHSRSCRKSIPNMTVSGLDLFVDPDGSWYSGSDLNIREWRSWRVAAMKAVAQGAIDVVDKAA